MKGVMGEAVVANGPKRGCFMSPLFAQKKHRMRKSKSKGRMGENEKEAVKRVVIKRPVVDLLWHA
jgi:hypothetical protein